MYKLTSTTSVIRLPDNASIPQDEGNSDYREYLAWLAEGNTPEPVGPIHQSEVFAQYEAALDTYLDSVAQGYRFKDRHSLALRAGYPSRYQPLGLAFGEWMESCNDVAYQGLQDVLDGKRALPTVDGMLEELPDWVAP